MLGKLLKRKLQVFAPVTGQLISLEEVPDPTFSKKMLGDGIAIMPSEGKIYSPVDAEITYLPATKHAIGLRTRDGTELLIHIGLETVSLKGRGFRHFVKQGMDVKAGHILVEVDLDYVGENAKSIITPIVITNSAVREITTSKKTSNCTAGKTVIMIVTKK